MVTVSLRMAEQLHEQDKKHSWKLLDVVGSVAYDLGTIRAPNAWLGLSLLNQLRGRNAVGNSSTSVCNSSWCKRTKICAKENVQTIVTPVTSDVNLLGGPMLPSVATEQPNLPKRPLQQGKCAMVWTLATQP